MNLIEHPLYLEDLINTVNSFHYWDVFQNKVIMIVGATGMVGSFIVDVLMLLNERQDLQCRILAIGRDTAKARKRFSTYWESPLFQFVAQDINEGIFIEESVNFVLHMASNTHPVAYATDPIGTIITNILGTKKLLEWSASNKISRFLYASSVEIYGENRGDVDYFNESYLGYLDCNTLRAGYPESKRVGESLCQAFRRTNSIDIVIARFSRIYGPSMISTDSKAIAQFLKNGLTGQNIVLKSEGRQLYSYTHVADAASAILLLFAKGVDGQAYNVADWKSDCTLKDLANLIADICKTKVVFELPSEIERSGFSKATKAVLDAGKLRSLGYISQYPLQCGIENTLRILRDTMILDLCTTFPTD